MNSTITAAIVAGFFTLISPIAYLLFSEFNKKRNVSNPDRESSLVGNWHGTLHYAIHSRDTKSPISIEVFYHENKIKGKANVKYFIPDNKEYSFNYTMTAKLDYDRFLKIEYRNTNTKIINTGVFFVELNPMGNSMSGYGVGYGSIVQDINRFSVNLEKME